MVLVFFSKELVDTTQSNKKNKILLYNFEKTSFFFVSLSSAVNNFIFAKLKLYSNRAMGTNDYQNPRGGDFFLLSSIQNESSFFPKALYRNYNQRDQEAAVLHCCPGYVHGFSGRASFSRAGADWIFSEFK